MTYETKDVWGFSDAIAAEVDIDKWSDALNAACTQRGIEADQPSDALDMSRDALLLEAATAVNADYEIVGDIIRLWRTDLTINWNELD